jgi:hypothetical protein
MHKQFFLTCNTLLHVSTLLGHLQGELFVVVTQLLTVYTVNSSTIKCNRSVATTNSCP